MNIGKRFRESRYSYYSPPKKLYISGEVPEHYYSKENNKKKIETTFESKLQHTLENLEKLKHSSNNIANNIEIKESLSNLQRDKEEEELNNKLNSINEKNVLMSGSTGKLKDINQEMNNDLNTIYHTPMIDTSLEVTLKGLQLDELIPHFSEFKITFNDFLFLNEYDFSFIGVNQLQINRLMFFINKFSKFSRKRDLNEVIYFFELFPYFNPGFSQSINNLYLLPSSNNNHNSNVGLQQSESKNQLSTANFCTEPNNKSQNNSLIYNYSTRNKNYKNIKQAINTSEIENNFNSNSYKSLFNNSSAKNINESNISINNNNKQDSIINDNDSLLIREIKSLENDQKNNHKKNNEGTIIITDQNNNSSEDINNNYNEEEQEKEETDMSRDTTNEPHSVKYNRFLKEKANLDRKVNNYLKSTSKFLKHSKNDFFYNKFSCLFHKDKNEINKKVFEKAIKKYGIDGILEEVVYNKHSENSTNNGNYGNKLNINNKFHNSRNNHTVKANISVYNTNFSNDSNKKDIEEKINKMLKEKCQV